MKSNEGKLEMVIGNTQYIVKLRFKESGPTFEDKMVRIIEHDIKTGNQDLLNADNTPSEE